MNEPTILVTGATGQVGFELVRALQGLGRVVAPDRSMLDLSDGNRLATVVREIQPSFIINPAAYTAVDRAESDADAAMRVNATAPGRLRPRRAPSRHHYNQASNHLQICARQL